MTQPHWAAALHAPVAPLTWEVQADLPDQQQETGRIPLQLPGPMVIVGAYASVIQTTNAGGLVLATPEDIVVQVDINQKDRITNRLEQTGPGNSFVTLAALATQAPRLLMKAIRTASPDLGINFRWKRPIVVGTPFYEDTIVSLAFDLVDLEPSPGN